MEVGMSPKGCSSVSSSSPYSSPNLSALLKIKIISWSQATGLPVAVQVQVGHRIFCLHKLPLSTRSGYFKKHLLDHETESSTTTTTMMIELPLNFPGGSETFEMIALFIYGSSTFIDPFNVAALRCASNLLEMTSEYGSGNLIERTDLYLNQVVLQNWDDTLIVLQKCQAVLPWAEDLLIVSRCIESLAFMACMEILDPEGRRDRPGLSLDSLATQPWRCDKVKEIVCQHLWIKDLVTLPFGFFRRFIASLRRQGMKEKFVSPIVVFYANKWVLSYNKTRKFWECLCDSKNDDDDDGVVVDASETALDVLRGILDLLPSGGRATKLVPVGFYFALLSRSIQLGLETKSRNMLQNHIVLMLPLSRVEDFLLPVVSGGDPIHSTAEFSVMINIFAAYVSSNPETDQSPPTSSLVVAELWDSYLSYLALDPTMEPQMFLRLIETVPVSYRQSHDCLYKAIAAFLQAHPSISQDEKSAVCQHLNTHKMTQEACIEAVQNELMPLRLIVQALFVQQLNTQRAFKDCSDSFRYTQGGDLSGSISSSRHLTFKSANLGESPYMDGGETESRNLSCLIHKDLATGGGGAEMLSKEYESTSFRIQTLEKELLSLKKSLNSQKLSKESEHVLERSLSNRRNTIGQVTGCIGSASFASHRRYAGRILRVFRRMILLGRPKPKRRSVAPASLWPKSV